MRKSDFANKLNVHRTDINSCNELITTKNSSNNKHFDMFDKSTHNHDGIFRNIAENAPLATVIWDNYEQILFWNKKAEALFGWTDEEMTCNNFPDFVTTIGGADNTIEQTRPEFQNITELFTCKTKCKNGSHVLCEWNNSIINDKEGFPKIIVSFARDITAEKQRENELMRLKELAADKDRLKTIFMQNVCHEIRTPMNAIMGFADLLTEYLDDKEELINFSAIIKQSSTNLYELTNDLLDFAKLETGQFPVHIEECNLSELFGELLQFFSVHSKKIDKNQILLSVKERYCTDYPIVYIDRGKCKQIFTNLIHNAYKFTTQGQIVFGCKPDVGNNLIFFVSDTGEGIPEEEVKQVFDRFTQLNTGKTSNIKGTGLGLSIVKGLIELLDGTITLESEVGVGSTFYFSMAHQAKN